MARRRIGQEDLIARPEPRSPSLTELAALLDWTEIDRHLVGLSAAAEGELGWPPLALFRALLLATWHDLSDVRLAEALDDRASFRRFRGFAAHEPTPERTAFVRFRRELVRRDLVRRDLYRALFEAVTRQLEAKGVMVRTGTLVDATLVPSASIRHDSEARWAEHRRRNQCTAARRMSLPTRAQAWSAASRSPRPMSTMPPSWNGCRHQSRARSTAIAPSPVIGPGVPFGRAVVCLLRSAMARSRTSLPTSP